MKEYINKMELNSRLEVVVRELDSIYDPLDKIEHVADFIKEILIAYGTKEVVLASPSVNAYEPEEIEEAIIEEYKMPLDEAFEYFKGGEKIIWGEPYWIYKSDTSIAREIQISTTGMWYIIKIVRLGIIDNRLMLTLQQGKAQSILIEDCTYDDNIEVETEWLKPGNIPLVDYWIELAKLLLNCDDIWKFNNLYPGLRKIQ